LRTIITKLSFLLVLSTTTLIELLQFSLPDTNCIFDYNYYGRSENTGFFSQQLIIAEGGFKSKLDTSFANQWMTTVNAS
jgi:hypothetical protein